MALVLLVAEAAAGEAVLGPDVAARFQDLGVTRVALLRDGTLTAVVLEGWAFDPAEAGIAAGAVFPGGERVVRTLHEIEQVAVPSVPDDRRTA
jgi:hypothetical protein